jgi:hypothetical protein
MTVAGLVGYMHALTISLGVRILTVQVILTNFEFSEEAVLPPQVLRITLDSMYKAEGKFKLGEIVCSTSLFLSRYVMRVLSTAYRQALLTFNRRMRLKPWRPSSRACTNV